MNKNKNTFSDLIYEIDRFINILNNKKKELLKASGEQSKELEPINKYSFDKVNKQVDQYAKHKFRAYTLNISKDDYKKLEKAAKNETVSSFIKNKYYLAFINNISSYMDWEVRNGKPVYKPNCSSDQTKNIALALNNEDALKFEEAADYLHLKPRVLMKFFINQFLHEYDTNNIRQDYKPDQFKGIKFKKCDSKAFRAYAYDEDKKILYVKFHSGSVYSYLNVPKDVYADLEKAESKGSFFNNNVINIYNYKKIC